MELGKIHLEDLVNSAERRRQDCLNYFHEPDEFNSMRLKVEQRAGSRVEVEDFDSIIKDFLKKRGIEYLSDFKPLDRKQIAILGETYHFVYKFARKSQDYRNPVPILKDIFKALEPIDNEYAAKLLLVAGDLMTKDTKEWRADFPRVVNFFEKILPAIFEEYRQALRKIGQHNGDDEQSKRKRASAESFYRKSLDIGYELLVRSIRSGMEFNFSKLEGERASRGIKPNLKTMYLVTFVR